MRFGGLRRLGVDWLLRSCVRFSQALMEDPTRPPKQNDSKFYVQGMRYAGVVFEFVGMILILGYVGNKVDLKYDSEPWGLLGGLLMGMGLGLYLMVKQLEKINR